MNGMTSRQRKLMYAVGMLALLLPIIWLGMPATDTEGSGGKLAQLRSANELGESTLGEVDPTSATMNLVLLGFRGIAASLLQLQADELKNTKNWAQLQSTVDSIILLQPHYKEVWRFQGWNLAFNVSVEWDAVEDRWYWVKEGCKFVKRGVARNRKYPELYWDVGHLLGHKIGRSDEWRFFRQFYKSDPDTETFGGKSDPALSVVDGDEKSDNYLAAKEWFLKANAAEDNYVQHLMMRMLFRQYPVRAQIEYAQALQREGFFDEITQEQWRIAYDEWSDIFGRDWFLSPGGWIFLDASSEDDVRQMLDYNQDKGVETNADDIRRWIDRYQKTANYPYWRELCSAEREDNTVAAHREIHQGQQLFKQGKTTPSWYRPRPGACDELSSLNLPEKHLAIMQALCGSKDGRLDHASLRDATGMTDAELFDALEPLFRLRKLVHPLSESQLVLEPGMEKFARMIERHPRFLDEDNTVEEGLTAVLYWRYLHQLNGLPVPEDYPLKSLWDRHQIRLPQIEGEFKRENGLQ